MLEQVALGIALMVATTFVHAGCTGLALRLLKALANEHFSARSGTLNVVFIAGLVVLLFIASLIESAIWAGTYVGLGAIETFAEALYFSIVTFTTLGFGDITLAEPWRLLSSFEAANGIVLFGWSTALVFAFVQHVAVHSNWSSKSSSER